jgi:hypothetical protein
MNSISTQDILAKINKATQTDLFNVIEINQINEGTISFIDKEGISDLCNGDINVILQFQNLKKNLYTTSIESMAHQFINAPITNTSSDIHLFSTFAGNTFQQLSSSIATTSTPTSTPKRSRKTRAKKADRLNKLPPLFIYPREKVTHYTAEFLSSAHNLNELLQSSERERAELSFLNPLVQILFDTLVNVYQM